MRHLILSREYPPSTYPRGGIGTYVEHIARLLAEHGETVHVIAERWDGAPAARTVTHDGRLVVHRAPLGRPLPLGPDHDSAVASHILESMAASEFPAQTFAWQAALLAETLVEEEGIDLIEGQDYEAPLYYLLLRRALGLGPARRPPCVVHLHSPWELVCYYNEWGLASDYDLTIKRLEDHAIAAADALLCPSQYLAAQAVSHYGLEPGSVTCIPYPAGDTAFVERPLDVWERGPVCYVGRMEPRKGVLEWIQAAVSVASERPDLRFEFIGADTSLAGDGRASVRAALAAAVPGSLSDAFLFLDALPPAALRARLARARMMVVPSRWENFPLTCVEAMASGLPVLASPHGGMAEMIEDGRTGWIAASGGPADLATTLRRALSAPAAARADMGRAAAESIRRLCDNREIVRRHLEHRQAVVARGAARSQRLPSLPDWIPPTVRRASPPSPRPMPQSSAGSGLAVVVVDRRGADLAGCLQMLRSQSHLPTAVVVAGPVDRRAIADTNWTRFAQASADRAGADGISALLRSDAHPRGVAVIDAADWLDPTYIETCDGLLAADDRLGVVSSWWERRDRMLVIRPAPALPYQWMYDDAGPCLTVRTAALDDLAWMLRQPCGRPTGNDLVLAVLAAGWTAVTWPGRLVRCGTGYSNGGVNPTRRAAVRHAILDHSKVRGPLDWPLLHHLLRARSMAEAGAPSATPRHVGRGPLSPATILRLPRQEQWRLVRRALRSPRYAWDWLRWHAERARRDEHR
jgi:glycosyltransferase involved in cell wall biosynthesis